MVAYRWVDGAKSPAGWLPVHQDQLIIVIIGCTVNFVMMTVEY